MSKAADLSAAMEDLSTRIGLSDVYARALVERLNKSGQTQAMATIVEAARRDLMRALRTVRVARLSLDLRDP